ncbi:hypothetical protein BK025_16610 [Sodalis sp. TME1]|nr:hypothetical protein BK025_16610 [Sodalis sp. TME1]
MWYQTDEVIISLVDGVNPPVINALNKNAGHEEVNRQGIFTRQGNKPDVIGCIIYNSQDYGIDEYYIFTSILTSQSR